MVTLFLPINLPFSRSRQLTQLNQFSRHLYMLISEIVTFFLYAISMLFLPEYFGKSVPLCSFVPVSLWRTTSITIASLLQIADLSLSPMTPCRSYVRPLRAVRLESCGYGRDQRISSIRN